jgi:2-dehydro-3-deoxyphosphogalactonate aldolase
LPQEISDAPSPENGEGTLNAPIFFVLSRTRLAVYCYRRFERAGQIDRFERRARWELAAMNGHFAAAMSKLPLVAILRGIAPAQAPEVLRALVAEGFLLIEVPLNSPEPFASIRAMRAIAPPGVLVGAGTVLSVDAVEQVANAGGELIVIPHADTAVIAAAKSRGLIALPGVATPTEAFAALAAGADGLKAFPAEMITPAIVKAWRAVLPKAAPVFPVGGIAPDTMAPYVAAGANGFGLGSALYRPGDSAEHIKRNAAAFAAAWRALRN